MKRICALSEVKPGEIFRQKVGGFDGMFIKIADQRTTNVLNIGSWLAGSIDSQSEVEVIGKCELEKYE